jgi:sugar phosphate isomerase/epimerase
MDKIPVGLQLYTLREETKQDFFGTLERVAAMGYRTVEFAGYGGVKAAEMAKALGRTGLQAVSSHVGLERIGEDLEGEIAYLQELGAKYMVIPSLEAEKLKDEAEFLRLAQELRRIGERCKESGLELLYHNHDFEFAKRGESYLLDLLFEAAGKDRMQAELDLYWVAKAGLEPESWLDMYRGRVPMVHVKDMEGDVERFYAEVGSGVLDYPSILKTAEGAGVQHFIVEQDACRRPPLESVKMSIDYLKSIGIA